MGRFTYVFTQKDRDKLVAAGLSVFQSDINNNIFIFLTEEVLGAEIKMDDIIHIFSDTITYTAV